MGRTQASGVASMVFFIAGPDTRRARKTIADIVEKFHKDVPNAAGAVRTIAGTSFTVAEVKPIFASVQLLARRQLIIVDGLLAAKKHDIEEAVVSVLAGQQGSAQSNIVIFFEEEASVKASPLFSWLKKNARCQTYTPLRGEQLHSWVVAECKALGRIIAPRAVSALAAGCGGDTWRLVSELGKIDAYLPVGAPIGEDVLALLFAPTSGDTIFTMIDAAVRGDLASAASLLYQQLSQGMSSESVVSLLEQQLRVLLLLQTGASTNEFVGLHPFVVKKLQPLARQRSLEQIQNAYAALADVDVRNKRGAGESRVELLAYLTKHFSAKASLGEISSERPRSY